MKGGKAPLNTDVKWYCIWVCVSGINEAFGGKYLHFLKLIEISVTRKMTVATLSDYFLSLFFSVNFNWKYTSYKRNALHINWSYVFILMLSDYLSLRNLCAFVLISAADTSELLLRSMTPDLIISKQFYAQLCVFTN